MKTATNPSQKFVSQSARVFRDGKKLSPSRFRKSVSGISQKAPRVLIFAPHPDDECITGALALRLLREAKWKVVNVAVTLGSERKRQMPRLQELKNACEILGFDLIASGLEQINLETRSKSRAQWRASVESISKIFAEQKPCAIFLPHKNDFHPTHIGTHFLVLDALKTLPKSFNCFVVETEFWGQMTNPNLLVESDVDDVARLVSALACHVGEVRRNPYHARLPAWMMDNVRRAEIVGGQGGASPDFTFGTMYRLQKWRAGKVQDFFKGGKFLDARENPSDLFGT